MKNNAINAFLLVCLDNGFDHLPSTSSRPAGKENRIPKGENGGVQSNVNRGRKLGRDLTNGKSFFHENHLFAVRPSVENENN